MDELETSASMVFFKSIAEILHQSTFKRTSTVPRQHSFYPRANNSSSSSSSSSQAHLPNPLFLKSSCLFSLIVVSLSLSTRNICKLPSGSASKFYSEAFSRSNKPTGVLDTFDIAGFNLLLPFQNQSTFLRYREILVISFFCF